MVPYFSNNQTDKKTLFKFSFYNKKISKIDDKTITYKPRQNILNCIIKFDKKKTNIEDYSLNSVWKKGTNLNYKEFKKLHSFFGYLL